MYCVIQNMSCQTGFSTTNTWFDKIFFDEETQFMQDMSQAHTHTYTHLQTSSSTHTQKTVRSLIYLLWSVQPQLSVLLGQQLLLDNRWLSNTATVRGHTHGPIRIYPTFLRCCLNDTGYHVKGHLTHTVYTPGTFFITVLNRQLCIFLSAYIPWFGVGHCFNVKGVFFDFHCTDILWSTQADACLNLLNVAYAEWWLMSHSYVVVVFFMFSDYLLSFKLMNGSAV